MLQNILPVYVRNVYPAPVTTCTKCGDPCDPTDGGICDPCVSVALDPMPTDPPTPNYAPYRCNGFCDCCHTFAMGVSLPYFNSVQGIYSALHKCDPCAAIASKPQTFGNLPAQIAVKECAAQHEAFGNDQMEDYRAMISDARMGAML